MKTLAAFLLAPLIAGGCVASTGYAVVTAHQGEALVRGPSDAWAALPPAAGKVLSVTERDEPPRLTQRIVLDGAGPVAGENFIVVTTLDRQSSANAFGGPPRPEEIERDMAAAFPGVRMARTLAIEQNGLGPFGTAYGSTGAYTCIYTWQRTGGVKEVFGPASIPVDVRVRLCRQASREALAAYVRALVVYVGPTTTVDYRAGALTVDPLTAASGMLGR